MICVLGHVMFEMKPGKCDKWKVITCNEVCRDSPQKKLLLYQQKLIWIVSSYHS